MGTKITHPKLVERYKNPVAISTLLRREGVKARLELVPLQPEIQHGIEKRLQDIGVKTELLKKRFITHRHDLVALQQFLCGLDRKALDEQVGQAALIEREITKVAVIILPKSKSVLVFRAMPPLRNWKGLHPNQLLLVVGEQDSRSLLDRAEDLFFAPRKAKKAGIKTINLCA